MRRDLVVLGASAGGVAALRVVLAGLPPDLAAAVLVVLHVPAGESRLPLVLGHAGPLPVRFAVDGDEIVPGRVLVAPPGRHLGVRHGRVELGAGPRENGFRPAVDVLFRTAARDAGPRVVAIVLSGALDDGSAGLAEVVARGGAAVVQDPADALHASMPSRALAAVEGHPVRVAPADALAGVLVELVGPGAEAEVLPVASATERDRTGADPVYVCPDCGGPLRRVDDRYVLRFRCRVGHAWSAASLRAAQDDGVEQALWAALRALEEKAQLARDLHEDATRRGNAYSARLHFARAEAAERAARTLRDATDGGPASAGGLSGD